MEIGFHVFCDQQKCISVRCVFVKNKLKQGGALSDIGVLIIIPRKGKGEANPIQQAHDPYLVASPKSRSLRVCLDIRYKCF